MKGRIGQNFLRIQGPPIWSDFFREDTGTHERPNRSKSFQGNTGSRDRWKKVNYVSIQNTVRRRLVKMESNLEMNYARGLSQKFQIESATV